MMEGGEDDGRKGGWKEGRMMEGREDDGVKEWMID